jgi:DNA modification methylase
VAVIDQEINDRFAIYNADCMEVLPSLKEESIGLSVYSPPFPELYQYSNDPRDMSNCTRYEEGIDQFRFIVNEVRRLTMPGRLTCVHCMDLKKGSLSQRDFPGDIVRVHEEAGFHFFCRITIWKDPWLIARRTRMRSLMHKSIVNDSSGCRVAGPDYVLVFKKGGENPEPIIHPHGLKTYAGETPIPEDLLQRFGNFKGDQRKNLLSHWIWRQYASPVWTDIRSGRLMPYVEARENEEEKHVCPLQLDVIDRCLTLWSNPGDKVLTPFMGVGSEVFAAVSMGRLGVGCELKPTYYAQAKRNLASIGKDVEETTGMIFDLAESEQ